MAMKAGAAQPRAISWNGAGVSLSLSICRF